MLHQGVIEPSTSPYASPVVIVPKPDGRSRFCVDYRKLNAITHKDAYPLPRIDDTLDALQGCTHFSTLDLQSGYWQVPMAPDSKKYTAFATSRGLYQFRRMPFGLSNAPATFQRLMNSVLQGLLLKHCLIYLDDVIVFGRNREEHNENLRLVMDRLRSACIHPNKTIHRRQLRQGCLLPPRRDQPLGNCLDACAATCVGHCSKLCPKKDHLL